MAYLNVNDDIKIYFNYIKSNYYRESRTNSDKLPILFIHGFAVNWTFFKDEISYFKKRGYPIVYFDLRGHGKSTVLDTESKLKIDNDVNDIKKLLDYLNLKRVYVVGHSLGGIIAAAFTSKHQEYVKKLVILNSTPHKPKANILWRELDNHHYLAELYSIVRRRFLSKNNKDKNNKNNKSSIKNPNTKYYKKKEWDVKRVFNTVGRKNTMAFFNFFLNTSPSTFFYLADILFNLKIKGISRINCPTLILESDYDEFFSYDDEINLNKKIKKSIMKVFPGNHNLPLINPRAVSIEINQFFNTKESFGNINC